MSQLNVNLIWTTASVTAGIALVMGWATGGMAADNPFHSSAAPLFERFCFECHGNNLAEAEVNLQQLASDASFATKFKTWQKIVEMLEQRKMPPEDVPQPDDTQRKLLIKQIQAELQHTVSERKDDPGLVVMRRLTSAEYNHTIHDLTGLDLGLQFDLVGDAVGGEGFTNIGVVQFLDEATLERYLAAAKRVADHAVIGTGPLQFFDDPGKTGFELSAINRIQDIYRRHGFRSEAGEGGEPYGLDQYPRAIYAAWRYLHRQELGLETATLKSVALDERLDSRFVQHIYSVLNQKTPTFPTSQIIACWRSLPTPAPDRDASTIRSACDELYQYLHTWQRRLAAAATHEEEASLLTGDSFQLALSHQFIARVNCRPNTESVKWRVSVAAADRDQTADPVVVWKHAEVRIRQSDRRWTDRRPLKSMLSQATAGQLELGVHPEGVNVAPNDFVTCGYESRLLEVHVPKGTRAIELRMTAMLDVEHGPDCVVRGEIVHELDKESVSALMADPSGDAVEFWKQGATEFARLFPQVSHREPAPSDRDPIPAPFDNTYNTRERDFFHYKVKYHRDDRFLVEQILDDSERQRLDQAWFDLLTSFEYHDIFLRFVAEKYDLDVGAQRVADLDRATIEGFPREARQHVRRLHDEYLAASSALADAQAGHIHDVVRFASHAWRRPLSDGEQQRLQSFYERLRSEQKLSHPQAIRATVVRALTAPEFIYRAEKTTRQANVAAISDWELASRLSYFLWASLPDEELRCAAANGSLKDESQLVVQTRRMLRDPKARRFAQEFFGQWFGFYQFDRYRGVDRQRFPEFDEQLQAAMYEEAISFFEYIVREDRPAVDILFADYSFLNHTLARHYNIETSVKFSGHHQRFEGASRFRRGGLLGLGAILTTTSAPLRTSPVKRGDWILRRVIGTPVPPPPADAGSIPADDVLADGLTLRKRLEAHRQQAACRNCHSRIDPLGFALEHYDAIGRWRDEYRDGQAIDSSGVLDNGVAIEGPEGLRRYLRDNQQQFHRTLCSKMLGFALGRRELASDADLLDNMVGSLEHGGTFSSFVEALVTSKQFRTRRGLTGHLSNATARDPVATSDKEPKHDDN